MNRTVKTTVGNIQFKFNDNAHERLRIYLRGLYAYYQHDNDRDEILEDIEMRMAEIFVDAMYDTKDQIELEDVEHAIALIGEVDEIEAVGKFDKEFYQTSAYRRSYFQTKPVRKSPIKRLFRDRKRRKVAGVFAGVSHMLGGIDPMWLRIAYLLSIPLTEGIMIPVGILSYAALWFITPPSDDLEFSKKTKRFFLNKENRMLGGVASGLANFFNVDETIVRIGFALSTFAWGFGPLLYILLLLSANSPRSLAERLEMEDRQLSFDELEAKWSSFLEEKGELYAEPVLNRMRKAPKSTLLKAVKALRKRL